MRLELKDLVNRLDITTLYVTHDQAEALALSDRVAVMNQGQINQEGSPRNIYLQPKDAFTANFIGRVNLYEGKVVCCTGNNGLGMIATAIGQVMCPLPNGVAEGDSVQLMIRPEGINILETTPAKERNIVDGKIELVTFQGDTVEYEIHIRGQRCKVKSDSLKEIGKDRKVNLYFPPERCLVVRS